MPGIRRLFCWMLAAVLCTAAASASAPVLGSSSRAMSPNATAQSYGARLQETALGCYAADSLCAGSGAQLAILCGGQLVQSLPGGPITMEDVQAVFSQEQQVLVVEIQAGTLYQALEHGVSQAALGEDELLDPASGSDSFPQISGFSFTFDVSQLSGRRVREVVLADGSALDRKSDRRLTLAVTEDMLDGSLGYSMLTGLSGTPAGTQVQLLAAYIQAQGQITVPDTGRISMLGSAGQTLYQQLHLGVLLPYVILILLLLRLPRLLRRRNS